MRGMEEVVNWEQERRAAKRVLEYLEHEREQQSLKRRWIVRNWPESGDRRDKKVQLRLREFVPELLQRGKEEPSLRSVSAFVGRSLDTLLKQKIVRKRSSKELESGEAFMKLDATAPREGLLRITDAASQADNVQTHTMVVKEDLLRITDGASDSGELCVLPASQKWVPPTRFFSLKEMDEAEIVTSLPCVLDTLHIAALQLIFEVLTGFPTRVLNRRWLEERIVLAVNDYMEELGETLPEAIMEVIEIMRDENSARKPMSSGNLFALPPCSILAVHAALDQVESLPLRTLHAMFELIRGKELVKVRLEDSLTGGNRDRLAKSLRRAAEIWTHDLEDEDPLPEPLTKALRAMSLSATELGGNDGNLMSIIGRPPPEVDAVHNKLLVALSQLKKLEFRSLASLSNLVHEGAMQFFCKEHPTYLRSHFRRILLDFLLRCDDPDVPTPIQLIIDAIATADAQLRISPEKSKTNPKKPKKPDRVSKRSMWTQGERNGEEVEAVLEVGSHLEQMVREMEEAERSTLTVPVDDGESCDPSGVSDEVDFVEDVAVRTAADEAGTLCYVLLGRALEEIRPPAASPLPQYVQIYLRGGFHRVVKQGESAENSVDEVDLLMKIAASMPGVSTRALQNMEQRLGLR